MRRGSQAEGGSEPSGAEVLTARLAGLKMASLSNSRRVRRLSSLGHVAVVVDQGSGFTKDLPKWLSVVGVRRRLCLLLPYCFGMLITPQWSLCIQVGEFVFQPLCSEGAGVAL